MMECFSREGSFILPEDLAHKIFSGAEDVWVGPRESVIGYGKVDTNIYIVAEGILRAGYFDGNKEVTLAFTDIGTMFMSLHGYFAGKPAFIYYQACSKCLLKRISKEFFDNLIEESPVFARWVYSVAIHQLYALERKVSLINGTVKERYLALIKNRPDIIKNVSMKVIASWCFALLSVPVEKDSFERINFGNWENCYTFASHITDYRTVRWVSGLNQQFAKLPYGLPYRGFESPPHRNKA